MQRSEFRLLDRLRVRWAEIDAQQIVFNGHYLMYFDTAVAAYWRAMAMPYAQTMSALGGDLFVRKATLEYLGSARYDDVLDIGIRCGRIGNSSMTLTGAVFRQDQLLVSGELVYVFADAQAQRPLPVPVPPTLRDAMQAFEAGDEMVTVQLGAWRDLGPEARVVRTEVFVNEQKIAATLEWDSADDDCVHALARNRFGQVLATGRLLVNAPGIGRLGRMAVVRSMRGTGIGRQVFDALMMTARERGDREVVLNAQTSAVAFYEAAGFKARGPGFEEAGIAHVEMACPL